MIPTSGTGGDELVQAAVPGPEMAAQPPVGTRFGLWLRGKLAGDAKMVDCLSARAATIVSRDSLGLVDRPPAPRHREADHAKITLCRGCPVRPGSTSVVDVEISSRVLRIRRPLSQRG